MLTAEPPKEERRHVARHGRRWWLRPAAALDRFVEEVLRRSAPRGEELRGRLLLRDERGTGLRALLAGLLVDEPCATPLGGVYALGLTLPGAARELFGQRVADGRAEPWRLVSGRCRPGRQRDEAPGDPGLLLALLERAGAEFGRWLVGRACGGWRLEGPLANGAALFAQLGCERRAEAEGRGIDRRRRGEPPSRDALLDALIGWLATAAGRRAVDRRRVDARATKNRLGRRLLGDPTTCPRLVRLSGASCRLARRHAPPEQPDVEIEWAIVGGRHGARAPVRSLRSLRSRSS